MKTMTRSKMNRKYTTRELVVGDVLEKDGDTGFTIYVVGVNKIACQTMDGTVYEANYSIFTRVNITASHGSMNARGYEVVGLLTDKGLEQARRGTVPPSGEVQPLEEPLIYNADLADKVNKIEAMLVSIADMRKQMDHSIIDEQHTSNTIIESVLDIILV
jgi:hypothetical protein